MPLHFAARRNGHDALVARILTPRIPRRGANDNGRAIGDLMGDPEVLRATLLHFARHGLAAAELARAQAEAAHKNGDDATFRHWLAVVRQLDRRMALRMEVKVRR